MAGGVALTYHERYAGRGFVPRRTSWSRYALALRSFEEAALFRHGLRPYRQVAATDDELLTVHTPAYLAYLREMDARGEGMVDGRQITPIGPVALRGPRSTPAYTGMLLRELLA